MSYLSAGIGAPIASASTLTAGTMTVASAALVRLAVTKFQWTNAMVIAAAGTANKINICTLPAKTIVYNCYVVIDTAATQAATLTVQVGPSTGTTGFVLAADAKAAANTVYGDAVGEVGANLYDTTEKAFIPYLPSYTTTTLIQAQYTIGAGTLADVLTSTGTVFITHAVLP